MEQAVLDRLDRIESLLRQVVPAEPRRWMRVREFAEAVGRNVTVVSRWCKEGRLKAVRSAARQGPHQQWRIPVSEVRRYEDEGLLPA